MTDSFVKMFNKSDMFEAPEGWYQNNTGFYYYRDSKAKDILLGIEPDRLRVFFLKDFHDKAVFVNVNNKKSFKLSGEIEQVSAKRFV